MAFPVTAKPTDTRLIKLKKILGTYQNLGGALAKNNPKATDTLYVTMRKMLDARNGV